MLWLLHGSQLHFHSKLSKVAHVCTVIYMDVKYYDDIRIPQFFSVVPQRMHMQCVPVSFSSSIQRAWVRG